MENLLGKRIKQRMFDRDINQKQLSEIVGVGQSQISRIIKGERGTDLETVKKIAQALGDSQVEYVLLLANLEKSHEARVARVENLLEEMSEQEQEMAERMIESIRPSKTKKSSNKQGA